MALVHTFVPSEVLLRRRGPAQGRRHQPSPTPRPRRHQHQKVCHRLVYSPLFFTGQIFSSIFMGKIILDKITFLLHNFFSSIILPINCKLKKRPGYLEKLCKEYETPCICYGAKETLLNECYIWSSPFSAFLTKSSQPPPDIFSKLPQERRRSSKAGLTGRRPRDR